MKETRIVDLYNKQLIDEIKYGFPKRLVVDTYKNVLSNMKYDNIKTIDDESIAICERLMCSYLKKE